MFIPDYIINRLTDIDVISLAERLGINVIRRRRALCFMHDDHNPSLTFYPKTNSWYCWVCDKGGSTIDLVSNFYNLDFQHSLYMACKRIWDKYTQFKGCENSQG